MATIPVTSALLTSLEDSSGNGPVLGSAGAFLTLHQRTSEPPALPTLTSSTSIDGDFHNLQQTHPGSFITSGGGAGTPSLGNSGLNLASGDALGCSLSSTNSWVRKGTWWSEGVLSFTPQDISSFKRLDFDSGQGGLAFKFISGSWRFVVTDPNGSDVTFTAVTVPQTSTSPGSIPSPFYYRFLRELPASGTGSYHLIVNDGTTTQTQTITGAANTIFPNPIGTTFGAGTGGTLNLYWFRGLGTNTNPTVGALQSTYWATPTVFSNVSYTSQAAASCLDSGTADEYFWQFGIHPGGQFTGITRNGGGILKNRFVGTNTGSGFSFSGDYQNLQDSPTALDDPQGRYLAIEWRYEPGGDWPLSSGGIHIRQESTEFGSANHFSIASNPDPIALPVPTEGTSQGTLPFAVESPVVVEHSRRVHRTRFSFPYSASRPMGTESRRIYQVRWVLKESDRDTLVAFFEARDGEQAFTWTVPGDSSTSLAALISAVEIRRLASDAYEIQATMAEVK